jgi:hypothetical protein
MRARSLVAFFAILMSFHVAHADGRSDVEKKIKEAMEQYDLMDYDAARKLLNQALATAKKSRLDKDAVSAKAYLDLGIVAFVNNDKDAAKLSFLSAVQIDSKIQIDPAYKTADMAKLLDEARGDAGGGAAAEPVADSGVDCSGVKGLQHEIIDSAKGNSPLAVEALLGKDVTATKVSVFFRPEGATEFTEVHMSKQGECKYTGTIPAAGMKGSLVHYYVAAYDGGNKPVAAKGSQGSPNIIEVTAGPAVANRGDDEDPINGKSEPSGGGASGGGEVSSSVTVSGPRKPKILLAITGGAGSGYVSGATETNNPVKTCCFGGLVAVVMPEIGYYVSPQLSVSVAARIGLPLGANFDGHATAAPGALLRFRYAFSPSGQGIHIMGQAGAGILRNTIKIDNPMMGMDTDIVAQGPLLVGAGVGVTKNLSGNIAFIADLSGLAGIAVVDHLGSAPKLNNGFAADLSIGLALGF